MEYDAKWLREYLEIGRRSAGEGFFVLARSDCRRDAGPSWENRDEAGAKKTRQTDPHQFPNTLLDNKSKRPAFRKNGDGPNASFQEELITDNQQSR